MKVNERIVVARFRTRVRNLSAPTDAAEMQDKENFYSQLDAAVDKIAKGDIKILISDFNAKFGSDNSDYEHVMGRHGLGEMSDNGEVFAKFCGSNDMVIGGSLFPHRQVHKVTWVSRDGVMANRLLDVRNKRSFYIAFDHHLPIGEIPSHCKTHQLEEAAVKRSFVEELEKFVSDIWEGGSVDDQWNAIKNVFIATDENNLGEPRTQRKQ